MRCLWPLVLASAAGAAVAATGALSEPRQAELRNLVIQDCGSCHGLTLRGGLGKPLLPETLHAFGEESIATIILDGVAGTPMPPWRGLLSEDEALWIARELKSGNIR